MSSERTTAKAGAMRANGAALAPESFGWRRLAIVASIALVARLVYLHVASAAGDFNRLLPESQLHADEAMSIRLGAGAGPHPYLFAPLYPYFLALFTDAKGQLDASVVRVVQALIGSVSVALAASIAASIAGRRAGWIAGIAAALYGPLIHFDAALLPACVQTFFLTLGIAILVRDDRVRESASTRRRVLAWSLAGISIGCASALHFSSLFVAIAILAVAWITKRDHDRARLAARCAAFAAGVAIAIAPFTVRNVRATGEPVFLAANGGLEFWIGNHARATGLFASPSDYDFAADPVGHAIAERATSRKLSYADASSWWTTRALDDIRDDPAHWLSLLAEKAFLFAHPVEIPQLGESFERAREHAWPLRLPLDARVLLILALAAPLFFAVQKRSIAVLRWPLTASLAQAIATIVFFVSARARTPIVPIVIAAASIGAIAIFDSLRATASRSSRAAIASFALLGTAAIASWFVYDAPRAPLRIAPMNVVEERRRGMTLYAEGRFAEAADVYRRALENDDDPITRAKLASALRALSRFDEAAAQYRRVLTATPRDGVAWYEYGNLLSTAVHDLRGAEDAYRRAIEYEPPLAEAHFRLGLVLLDLNEPEDAAAAIESSLSLAPDDAPWRVDAENALLVARTRAGVSRDGARPK